MPLCRFCDQVLTKTFIDLGMSPLSNAFLEVNQVNQEESFYPLHAYVCDHCFLVQLEQFESPEKIFRDYVYFSSYSDSWLRHVENYTNKIIERFRFNSRSQVIEIASNDGYLLQYFKRRGIPVLGIEPASNVAKVAQEQKIPTLVEFFGVDTAKRLKNHGQQADLLIGNNVLAHVPNLNDFVAGIKVILKYDGIITMEFPHLLQLMKYNQFDTIYHEHFSYFSLLTVETVFAKHGLTLFDVEELPTHGGSLRVYGKHKDIDLMSVSERVFQLKDEEKRAGLDKVGTYLAFCEKVKATKRNLLKFLIEIKNQGKSIVGYGAAAKGNTLLNYCGIRTDFLDYVVDRSPHKQGLFLPGTHIPVHSPDKIRETKPNYVLILPWNIQEEISQQMDYIRTWGGQFVVPIPQVKVI